MSHLATAVPPHPREKRTGRLAILLAALMWSSGGVFAKSPLLDVWPVEQRGALLAFWRGLFAGGVLLLGAPRPRWTPRLIPMALCFVTMNVTYLTAMSLTTAANAIWLQATAPLWICAAGWATRTEAFDRRDGAPLVCSAAGLALILLMELLGGGGASSWGVLCGLASGAMYAGVVMSLRALRGDNPVWLVAFNHLVAAALLSPYCLSLHAGEIGWPSSAQLLVLAGFGVLQMAIPYLLFSWGLRKVSSQEGSLLTLVEPVLNPLWTFLAWGELPAWWTIAGGGLILVGLVVRYTRP